MNRKQKKNVFPPPLEIDQNDAIFVSWSEGEKNRKWCVTFVTAY